jgi:predicted nucleic acid-binding protein
VPSYAYLDASAIVKLVAREKETAALERDAATRDGLLASRLAAAEVMRAVRRVPTRRLLQQADDVLASFVLIGVTTPILDDAGTLSPADLRTLDAIHLATALSLDLPGLDFITYDDRLARAAAAHGLHVVQPGL